MRTEIIKMLNVEYRTDIYILPALAVAVAVAASAYIIEENGSLLTINEIRLVKLCRRPGMMQSLTTLVMQGTISYALVRNIRLRHPNDKAIKE
jgi:hypothetical protein